MSRKKRRLAAGHGGTRRGGGCRGLLARGTARRAAILGMSRKKRRLAAGHGGTRRVGVCRDFLAGGTPVGGFSGDFRVGVGGFRGRSAAVARRAVSEPGSPGCDAFAAAAGYVGA